MVIVASGMGWRGSVATAIAGGLGLTSGWRHGPTLPCDWHGSAVIDQPHGYEVGIRDGQPARASSACHRPSSHARNPAPVARPAVKRAATKAPNGRAKARADKGGSDGSGALCSVSPL